MSALGRAPLVVPVPARGTPASVHDRKAVAVVHWHALLEADASFPRNRVLNVGSSVAEKAVTKHPKAIPPAARPPPWRSKIAVGAGRHRSSSASARTGTLVKELGQAYVPRRSPPNRRR